MQGERGMNLVLFARVGWMRWYRGPQQGDEKPIGGGKYNRDSLGHEAFNFLPINGRVLGYFQPQLQPKERQDTNPSTIALERIQAGFVGGSLTGVLTVFFATDPEQGGQKIVGWFRASTVHRYSQESSLKARNRFSYFIEASKSDAVLVPEDRREFSLPGGKGGAGTANVCYVLEQDGEPKSSAWIADALDYINTYALENAVQSPASETDAAIGNNIAATIENAAGFQSNPLIRKAIEKYAMDWAARYLTKLRYPYRDTHKNKPYDFICLVDGAEVYVEVKGMQDNGKAISLTPREVEHAQKNRNFALIIVHSVKVKGERKPVVSGGELVFLHPWDIRKGTLEPRGFVYTFAD
jgi:hypothetical protein